MMERLLRELKDAVPVNVHTNRKNCLSFKKVKMFHTEFLSFRGNFKQSTMCKWRRICVDVTVCVNNFTMGM